jgi:hypothetical protein
VTASAPAARTVSSHDAALRERGRDPEKVGIDPSSLCAESAATVTCDAKILEPRSQSAKSG